MEIYRICKGSNIYNVPVIIFIGSYEEYTGHIKRKYKIAEPEQRFYGGCSNMLQDTKTGSCFCVIWMPKYNHTISDMGTLTHECLHAAMRILEACNVRVTFDNHEALAYLHGYLFEESIAALLHKK